MTPNVIGNCVSMRCMNQRMERFTIGRCRSGKVITSHSDLDRFATFEEIFDGMAVLFYMATKAHKKEKDSDLALHLEGEANRLEVVLRDSGQWFPQMKMINAKTSIDVRNHARELLRPEFKE